MKRLTWFLALVVFPFCTEPARAEIAEDVVSRVRRSVVNVQKSVSLGLNGERSGVVQATAFVVDAERGILATNRHVAGTSPSRAEVTFLNGETATARVLHYDAFHDFAFYRIDPSDVDFPLAALPLGDSFALNEQDPVVLVGNNDADEYSVKFGRVTNLVLDEGERHSATFQTSFDRAGGSSGSPVVNARGEVVGIHFRGSSTTSFELRIEYVKDALTQLIDGGAVRRGDIGVELDLIAVADARDHFHLPAQAVARVREERADTKWMIYIDRLIPGGTAQGALRPGDIVVEVAGARVGDDLYRFDRLIDEHVGSEVTLTVYRRGLPLEVRLPVEDAERHKVRRFAVVAGGVLQDLNPELRSRFAIEGRGVFLAQANPGTSMSELGRGSRSQPAARAVVIEELAGEPTPDLESLVKVLRPLVSGEAIYVVARDERGKSGRTVDWFDLDLKYDPLRVFEYDAQTLDWREADPGRERPRGN